jgi:hypothetical protein
METKGSKTDKILGKEPKWYKFAQDGDLFEKSQMVNFILGSGDAYYGYVYQNIKDKELSFSTIYGQTLLLENIDSVEAVKIAK